MSFLETIYFDESTRLHSEGMGGYMRECDINQRFSNRKHRKLCFSVLISGRVFGGDRDGMGRNSPPFKQLVTLYLTFILLADFDNQRTDRPTSKTKNGPCRTRSDSALLLNFIVPPGLAASLQLLLAHTSLSFQFTVGKVSPVDLSVPGTVISNDQPAVNDNDFP